MVFVSSALAAVVACSDPAGEPKGMCYRKRTESDCSMEVNYTTAAVWCIRKFTDPTGVPGTCGSCLGDVVVLFVFVCHWEEYWRSMVCCSGPTRKPSEELLRILSVCV